MGEGWGTMWTRSDSLAWFPGSSESRTCLQPCLFPCLAPVQGTGAETGPQDHEMARPRRPFCEGTGSDVGVTADILALLLSRPATQGSCNLPCLVNIYEDRTRLESRDSLVTGTPPCWGHARVSDSWWTPSPCPRSASSSDNPSGGKGPEGAPGVGREPAAWMEQTLQDPPGSQRATLKAMVS